MGRIIPNVATVFLHHKDDMDSGRPDDRIEFIEDIGGGQGKVTANIDAPYAYACVSAFKDCAPADSVVVPRDVINDVLQIARKACEITGKIDCDDAGRANDLLCDIIHALENPRQWLAASRQKGGQGE